MAIPFAQQNAIIPQRVINVLIKLFWNNPTAGSTGLWNLR